MKFGVREIVNVVFRAKTPQKIGSVLFKTGQPVFYLDSAKTSTLEGAATTVYAQGGRGNTRLISWEGEKTLTFTVEDALLSPISFAMLSGAGLIKPVAPEGAETGSTIHFHQTTMATIDSNGEIDLHDALETDETVCKTAPLYILQVDKYGDLTGKVYEDFSVYDTTASPAVGSNSDLNGKALKFTGAGTKPSGAVMVDYYILKPAHTVSELQIDAEHFAGNYYVEADTLFRRQSDGKDLPANLTLPNVKIQSNFTFSMASTGDPSTFTFTMDALPGYTYFDVTKKVLCAIQIVDDKSATTEEQKTIFPHPAGTADGTIPESYNDSVAGGTADGESDSAPDDTGNWSIILGVAAENPTSLTVGGTTDGSTNIVATVKQAGKTPVDVYTVNYGLSSIAVATASSASNSGVTLTAAVAGVEVLTATVTSGGKQVASTSITIPVAAASSEEPGNNG